MTSETATDLFPQRWDTYPQVVDLDLMEHRSLAKALGGDFTLRAAAAMDGIYSNDAVEALYPLLCTDSGGNKPIPAPTATRSPSRPVS